MQQLTEAKRQVETWRGLQARLDDAGALLELAGEAEDAETAAEDLQLLLDAQQLEAPPLAALLFTCNGRGQRLFKQPNHDIGIMADVWEQPPNYIWVATLSRSRRLLALAGSNHVVIYEIVRRK